MVSFLSSFTILSKGGLNHGSRTELAKHVKPISPHNPPRTGTHRLHYKISINNFTRKKTQGWKNVIKIQNVFIKELWNFRYKEAHSSF